MTEYPWLEPVEADGCVTGMTCVLCKRFRAKKISTISQLFGRRLPVYLYVKTVFAGTLNVNNINLLNKTSDDKKYANSPQSPSV